MTAHTDGVVDLAARGWTVLSDFLPADAVAALRQEAEGWQAAGRFHAGGVGRAAEHVVRREIRGDRIVWLDREGATPAQERFWPSIERLRLELNRELFLGLVSFEGHYALYPPGARYAAHVDRFES